MRTVFLLLIGLIVGVTAASFYWQAEYRKTVTVTEGLSRMWGDNLIMIGIQGTEALANGSPDATRDFTNYMIDSALLRAKAESNSAGTNKAYDGILTDKVLALPTDRRSLSPTAPKVYQLARQSIDAPAEKPIQ